MQTTTGFLMTGAMLALSVLLSLAAPHPASVAESADNWNVRGHVPVEKFIIQSHRGAGELAPENTLEAFELGWKLGTVPESDLRTTKDGVIVAFHDSTFERTVKNPPEALKKKGVQDITYAELLKLDVGGWKGEAFTGRKVSRISDVFKIMRGKPQRLLYLDIKNVDLAQLAQEVRENAVAGQVIFTSPKYAMIRDFKKLVPEAQTLNWMGGTEAELRKRLEEVRAADFAGLTQLQLHVRPNPDKTSAEPFNLSRQFIRDTGTELRKHGVILQSLPWGADQAEVYWQLMDLGVMAFATDHPEVVVKAVRDYYAQKPSVPPDANGTTHP
ncbi:MAG: glycerophosphodiester phosphodiesterase family protein [Verrucomicrobiales bacterium]|nr:glycerophosphodiester phosphodiesterase family protein [Verrucomicrobiales bacterium]